MSASDPPTMNCFLASAPVARQSTASMVHICVIKMNESQWSEVKLVEKIKKFGTKQEIPFQTVIRHV